MLWNQTMVNSILNEMRSVLRWFNHPSWSYGDNLVTLGGLLHKLIIGHGTFESVAEDPSDSSVLALVSTSMSSPICLLGPYLRNFALRIKVVPVSTLNILKVSLALVSIITCLAAEKIECSLFGFILAENTRSPTLKWWGSACRLLSWCSFKRARYKLHFDRCSRSSAARAYLNWTQSTVVLFESWRWNKTILGAFPLIWCSVEHKNFRQLHLSGFTFADGCSKVLH